ncbi:hypothetical protein KCU71_g10224, partial [Aureobasidium melanogenum]
MPLQSQPEFAFNKLPTELRIHIHSFLKDDTETLFNAISVNKEWFHRLIGFLWHEPWDGAFLNLTEGRRRQFYADKIRTIEIDVERAACLGNGAFLHWADVLSECEIPYLEKLAFFDGDDPPADEVLCPLLRPSLVSVEIPQEISNLIDDSLPGNEYLISLSIRGTVDALYFFLANTAASLRTLEIVLPEDYAQSDRDVCESILRFTNLRELCLDTRLLDTLPADGFAALGQMNYLEILKITPDRQDNLPGSSWTNNDFGEWILNFSELRELELLWRSPCLDENTVAAIGRSCQKLERCTLGWEQDISTWTALEDHDSVLFPRLKKLGICVVDEQSQRLQQVP